jgi:hypothetical protein
MRVVALVGMGGSSELLGRTMRADSAPAKGVKALGWCDQVFFLDPEEWFGGGVSEGNLFPDYASLISTSSRRV